MTSGTQAVAPRALVAIVALLSIGVLRAEAQDGVIDGRVLAGARGLRHVTVELLERGWFAETDSGGRYQFVVPAGVYNISLRLGGFEAIERNVTVTPGATALVETAVDWPLFRAETITVMVPSRLPERLVETSASATTLLASDVQMQLTHGQLPRLLASSPGVEVTQSGLYDFNLNARGFNTAVNRHVKTLIDGRDPSVPVLLGYQDWAANSVPLDDLERMEFIRGPGAALYGAGAFNGVLSIVTKSPRESLGGFARFTAGGLNTSRAEIRHAGRVGADTYVKLTGGYHHSADFTRARVTGTEYASGLLPPEVTPPPRDRLDIAFGTVRVDTAVGGDRQLVGEFGISSVRGLTTLTSAGRTQSSDSARPWARGSLTSQRWAVSAYYSGQQTDRQIGLSTGTPIHLNAYNIETEAVGNRTVARGRGRLVGGASFGWQRVDSADQRGAQTVFSAAQSIDRQAVFGEFHYRFSERLRGEFAGRVDRSDLHDIEFSPRGAGVFLLTPRQNLRFSASRAFQSPSVTEFFLSTPVAPPLDLSALESALAPVLGGRSLGFGSIPALALGNRNLRVEQVAGIGIGYSAVLSRRAFLTLDYYRSRLRDLTSNLLPQLGTPLGRINTAFGPYVAPGTLPPVAAAAVQNALAAALPTSLLSVLSNDANGLPVFVLLSFRNVGEATTQGVEAGLSAEVTPSLRLDASYSIFDHDLDDNASSAVVSPNTPRHRWSASAAYRHSRVSVSMQYRWVDDFDWASGLFVGPVPSYGVADAQGLYSINQRVQLGVDVANAFNREHYEVFGGDLLGRRVLTSIRLSW